MGIGRALERESGLGVHLDGIEDRRGIIMAADDELEIGRCAIGVGAVRAEPDDDVRDGRAVMHVEQVPGLQRGKNAGERARLVQFVRPIIWPE